MIFGLLVLITALTISAVAIYYSIAGLVAIFAAAALPIMVMGGALEVGKLVTAVWLHRYWHKAKWWLRWYLALAVVILMFITSMRHAFIPIQDNYETYLPLAISILKMLSSVS